MSGETRKILLNYLVKKYEEGEFSITPHSVATDLGWSAETTNQVIAGAQVDEQIVIDDKGRVRLHDRMINQIDSPKNNFKPMSLDNQVYSLLNKIFWLVALLLTLGILAVIFFNVPPYTLPLLVVAALLLYSILGAVVLRSEGKLSQENFIRLMFEALKFIPLVRKESTDGGSS